MTVTLESKEWDWTGKEVGIGREVLVGMGKPEEEAGRSTPRGYGGGWEVCEFGEGRYRQQRRDATSKGGMPPSAEGRQAPVLDLGFKRGHWQKANFLALPRGFQPSPKAPPGRLPWPTDVAAPLPFLRLGSEPGLCGAGAPRFPWSGCAFSAG